MGKALADSVRYNVPPGTKDDLVHCVNWYCLTMYLYFVLCFSRVLFACFATALEFERIEEVNVWITTALCLTPHDSRHLRTRRCGCHCGATTANHGVTCTTTNPTITTCAHFWRHTSHSWFGHLHHLHSTHASETGYFRWPNALRQIA